MATEHNHRSIVHSYGRQTIDRAPLLALAVLG